MIYIVIIVIYSLLTVDSVNKSDIPNETTGGKYYNKA